LSKILVSKNTQPRNGQTRKGQKAPVSSDVKAYIKKVVNSKLESSEEDKWINIAAMSVAASSTPSFIDVTSIGQGVTSGTRNGDTFKMKHLRISLACIVADATNLLRVVIFRWKMNNTSDVPSTAEIFQDPTATTRVCLSPLVVTKPSRFTMLFDKLFNLDQLAHPQIIDTINLKLNNLVSFDQGTSTGRDHIYFGFMSDSTAIAHPALSYESMVLFHDD